MGAIIRRDRGMPARRFAARCAVVTCWLSTLAACCSPPLSLGRWQLSRAAQKEALQAAIEAQQALPPLDMGAFLRGRATSHEPRCTGAVALRGLWLAARTRSTSTTARCTAQPGFYVLTPLRARRQRRRP